MAGLHCKLKALGDPTRLRILELLPDHEDCEEVYNVSGLAEALDVPQPTVSHHLKVLFNAHLVKSQKMCRDVYYWIDRKAYDAAIAELTRMVERNG